VPVRRWILSALEAVRAAVRTLDRLPGGRPVWLWAVGLVGAFVAGYLVAATVFFPAPIFARTISVPRVMGATQTDAEESIRSAGLQVGAVIQEPHARGDRGMVIWQDPPEGVGLPQGHAVDLLVSTGPQRIPVPDLSGYDAGIAERLVTAAGLSVGGTESTQAPAPAGVVINSRPPAGSTLLPGTPITLVVSVGAPTIRVPDLTGLTREAADSLLVDAGLALGTAIRRTSNAAAPGTVIGQAPAPGTLSAPGTSVNVTIARARNP
jgi:serine/threonine-protein kinase